MKRPKISEADAHALACFFAMHHGAHAISARPPGERNIERQVMSLFGLVTKKGKFALTPRGRRAIKLAQSD